MLIGLGLQFVRDAELAANECTDPAQKKFILGKEKNTIKEKKKMQKQRENKDT